jgi:DNA-directed RNA polymerase specialized sigma24 family protein
MPAGDEEHFPMATNVFPTTRSSLIDEALARGHEGRLEVNEHVMATYAWPLQVYFVRTNARWLGEPVDIVHGFFADRLARDNFFQSWRENGMRLRRWLINAFNFYLKEEIRRRLRDGRCGPGVEDQITFDGDPEASVDRAAALAFVRQAMDDAAAECSERGDDEHWRAFMRHRVDGTPYADIGNDIGEPADRVYVMSRTAERRFRKALRRVLAQDGVPDDRVDEEIRSLMEALS